MQSKKKGFTLIELLAVIVILAIIALIAVPVIMNVIGNARKSAFEDSVYGVIKAGEMYYTNELLENGGMISDKEFTITNGAFVGENKLEVSGSLPSSGKVTVTKEGKVAVALSNGEYYVQKTTSESEIKAHSLKEDNITEGELDYKKVANPVFTKATGETSVPTCITNNTACTAGTKVGVKVNNSQTYDFYVVSEDASEGTITLIMNQNLGGSVAWVSKADYISAGGTEDDWGEDGNSNKGPITVLNYLESQTSSWTNIPLETYTLIDEKNQYPTMTRTARARLITYTEASTLLSLSNGSLACENLSSSSTPYGYWTSSADAHNFGVYSVSYFNNPSCTSSNYIVRLSVQGVRPVMTISKNFL